MSTGGSHACGLRLDGSAECWGYGYYGQTDAPTGRFTAVAAGGKHTCGLRPGGTVECWGGNWNGQADAPAGRFATVTAGGIFSCGLRVDGTIVCWGHSLEEPGSEDGEPESGPEERGDPVDIGPTGDLGAMGPFGDVTASLRHSCGLRADGALECWVHPPGDKPFATARVHRRAPRPLHSTVHRRVGPALGTSAGCVVTAWSTAGAPTPGDGRLRRTVRSAPFRPTSGIPAGCGMAEPSTAGAPTTGDRWRHRLGSSRPLPPDTATRALSGPTAPSSAGAATTTPGINCPGGLLDETRGRVRGRRRQRLAHVRHPDRPHRRVLGRRRRTRARHAGRCVHCRVHWPRSCVRGAWRGQRGLLGRRRIPPIERAERRVRRRVRRPVAFLRSAR